MYKYINESQQTRESNILAAILCRIKKVEALLEGKTVDWKVEKALEAFEAYLRTNHCVPENFDYPLRLFRVDFRGRNVAEITPAEIEEFIRAHWGTRKVSTVRKRMEQIATFFQFCIRELRKRGSPTFTNPCEIVDGLKVHTTERHGFIPIERMLELLKSIEDEKHWLIVAIQLTGGLRIGEVLKLTPADVDGRVLTIRNPKSGREREMAVMPQNVAKRLAKYAKYMEASVLHALIFRSTRQSANRALKRHAEKLGLELTTHDLRRWCATFWERNGDMAMVRFVLRHSCTRENSGRVVIDPLAGRYVSVLSVNEAMARQDSVMPEKLGL